MAFLSFPSRWRSSSPAGWKPLRTTGAAGSSGSGAGAESSRATSILSKICSTADAMLGSRRVRLTILSVTASLGLISLAHRYGALPEAARAVWKSPAVAADTTGVDWSQFAYVQYVTNSEYLCNSVMLFERLAHLGSRPDRVMMYPSAMLDPSAASADSHNGDLLIKARDEYGVKLVPIAVQERKTNDRTWSESFTKLLAFNQTQYARVLSLDSDSVVLQPMDELFLLPPCPVAMPRAYWLYPATEILSSQIMLVTPGRDEFARVMAAVDEAGPDDYDMEIVNTLYRDSALVLPHRPYDLLTQVFRWEEQQQLELYLGKGGTWDAQAVLNEAKFLHFSDWPVPKPWLATPEALREDNQPKCKTGVDGTGSCVERTLWNGFYDEFRAQRERVCGLGAVYAGR